MPRRSRARRAIRYLKGAIFATLAGATALLGPRRRPGARSREDPRGRRAGLRRAHHGREGPLRRAHLDRGQADRRAGLDGLRDHRLAAALVRHARWSSATAQPDARWFGAEAELYADKRGAGVDELIARIDKAARAIRTRTVHAVARAELEHLRRLDHARGARAAASTCRPPRSARTISAHHRRRAAPSGSGFQFSLAGLLGFAASAVEGVELNLLGLNFGVPASGLKLPLRRAAVGADRASAATEAASSS